MIDQFQNGITSQEISFLEASWFRKKFTGWTHVEPTRVA
jgi:hypothetical protein